MDSLNLMYLIALAFAAVAGVVLLAMLRNQIVAFGAAALAFVGNIPTVIVRLIHHAVPVLSQWIHDTLDGLAYRNTTASSAPPPAGWVGWSLIGPFIYLIAFLLISAGDFYFSVLGFAALLGRGSPSLGALPFGLDVAAGVLFGRLSVIFGFMLLNLHGGTPIQRPWSNFGQQEQLFLKRLAAVCLILTCLAGISFTVWRQLQIPPPSVDVQAYEPPGPSNSVLPVFVWTLLAVLLVVGSAATGWATFASSGGLWALLLLVLRGTLHVLLAPGYLIVHLLRATVTVFAAALDVPASLGRGLWNGFAGSRLGQNMGMQHLTFDPVPLICADINTPLF